MTKQKLTKRSLIASGLALLMCVSMFVGSTFAWFTDSVATGVNTIVSGNLDVELYYQNDSTTGWTKPTETSNIFKKDALWEPGHTEVIKLKVVNEGSLALKYQFAINILKESLGINVDNETFKLSDYIHFAILEGDLTLTREEAVAEAEKATATKLSSKYSQTSFLEKKGQEDVITMVVYMPESVGNKANYKSGTEAPTITLGLHLFATQYTYEADSYGIDYDEGAPWVGDADTSWYNTTDKEFTLTTAAQLAGLAEIVNSGKDTFVGKTIKLGADVDLNNVDWTPIGTTGENFSKTFGGSFIGNGHTISNLYVNGGSGIGFFGRTGRGAHIEGLVIDGAYVSGSDYVGAVAGYAYLSVNCIKNCTVKNATVIATPFKMADGKYDGGAKAGGIVGFALNGNLTGNTVENVKVYAYRDLGAIAGRFANDGAGVDKIEISGSTITDVEIGYVGVSGIYGDGKPNQNMGDVVGVLSSKAYVGENEIESLNKEESNKGVTVIYTLDELIAFAKEVNSGNDFAKKVVMLGDDINLNNMEWTPIGANGAIFKGTFDGNGKTVSNLKITGNNSSVGLFGNTHNGEIKNLTVENANVSGRLNVAAVAGNPYTTKYNNITVKGHVEINGLSYVGAVGGKNAYTNWDNITVNADETSYVRAISRENGIAYRTYVGGVIGFMGEGGHTVSNVTSNIDVYGDVGDIGGIVGIAHYNNKFVNITCTGDVILDTDTKASINNQIGGIAGVWMNSQGTVSFTNCVFTGKIIVPEELGVNVVSNTITGASYNATGAGKLIIDGVEVVFSSTATDVDTALAGGKDIVLTDDLALSTKDTTANSGYGATGLVITDNVFDGNGKTLSVSNANGTWDCAVMITGGTIKNLTIDSGFRGIFVSHKSVTPGSKVYIENVTVDGPTYTISCDQANYKGLEATNSTFNGWTSYAATLGDAKFVNCSFGEGAGYAFCRPYAPTTFVGCNFSEGYLMDPRAEVTFENCTLNGVAITAENVSTLVYQNADKATVK